MTNPNGAKGSATERMIVKYLQAFFPAAERRLREGRRDDQGDIDGVPLTTIQVKYQQQLRRDTWVRDTIRQRDTAGNPLCLLIVRVPRKPVEQWETYLPGWHFTDLMLDESEAWTWIRMDLVLAVAVLQHEIDKRAPGGHSLWVPSSSTTTSIPGVASVEWHSAPSTGSGGSPSPTT